MSDKPFTERVEELSNLLDSAAKESQSLGLTSLEVIDLVNWLWGLRDDLRIAREGLREFGKENLDLYDDLREARSALEFANDTTEQLLGDLHAAADREKWYEGAVKVYKAEVKRLQARLEVAEQVADIAISYMEGR